MSNFLASIAQNVLTTFPKDASNLTIVFPNKRSGLFFIKHLQAQLTQPIFLPEVLEIDVLITKIARSTRPDDLQLLAWLYEAFCKVLGDKEENFTAFYPWGQMMLADFMELDKQLVPYDQLFTNLKDQKELDSFYGDLFTEEQKQQISSVWGNIDNAKNSAQKEKFMRIWLALPRTYEIFQHQLGKQKLATEGAQYKQAYLNVENWLAEYPDKQFWFIGLNDLTNSEQKLIAKIIKADRARIFWDTDESFFTNNKWLEAGYFQRKYVIDQEFVKTINRPFPNYLDREHKPTITATAVSLIVGQAKLLPQLLADEMSLVDDQSKIAVLLPDTGMLFPVLNALPKTVKLLDQVQEEDLLVNVSMGFPFRQTPVYALFYYIIEAQKSAREGSTGLSFYHDFVLSVVQHPYIISQYGKEVNELVGTITKENLITVPKTLLDLYDFGKLLFPKIGNITEALIYLQDVITNLSAALIERNPDNVTLDDEYFFATLKALNRFKEVIVESGLDLDMILFWQMVMQLLEQISIPFAGEPLEGLQILGMLESRNLDFDTVIVLGANEGLLPKQGAQGSFIPYNLRRVFGLQTHTQQDATQAYLFYRLLFRAKRVHLVYNAESTEQIKGEPTRYLYQLMYGLEWPIINKVLGSPVAQLPVLPISVNSSADIQNKIVSKFASDSGRTLDPSAITTFIDCKLKFYLRYVAEIKEEEQITEEAQTNAVGQLLHHSMEWIYEQLRQSKHNSNLVLESDLPWLKNKVDEALQFALEKEGYPTTELQGQLNIITEVVKHYIFTILDIDSKYAPFKILELETTSREKPWIVAIETEGQTYKFKLGGRIDRIDQKGDKIRVIDYKTGDTLLNVDSLAHIFGKTEKDKLVSAIYQILHYSQLFTVRNPEYQEKIEPGIFSMRKIFADYDEESSQIVIGKGNPIVDYSQQIAPDFVSEVKELLQTIMATDTVFDQTSVVDRCKYCSYKTICQR